MSVSDIQFVRGADGRYSRRRLLLLGAAWIAVAAAVFLLFPDFTASAHGGLARMCTNTPCEFPMEHGESGIIMGTSYMNGTQVHHDNCDGGTGDYTSNGGCIYETPNGGEEPIEKLGVDDVNPDNLFFYKSWKDYNTRTNAYEDVYIWFNVSSQAEVGAPTTTDCKGSNCDLLAYITELASPELTARAFGITFNMQDYWTTNPQDDICSFTNADKCLETAGEGNAFIKASDAYFRVHKVMVGPQSSDDKYMQLNDVTAEIRWGEGQDSVHNVYGTDPNQLFSVSHTCKGNRDASGDGNAHCEVYEDFAMTGIDWYVEGEDTQAVQKFQDPVAIAWPRNAESSNAGIPHIDDVGTGCNNDARSCFDLAMDDWESTEGTPRADHNPDGFAYGDNVHWIVGDLGHYTMPTDGADVEFEFGTIDSETDSCCNTESFDTSFPSTPVVFAQINTGDDYGCGMYCGTYDDTAVIRQQNVDSNGFGHQMQEYEAYSDGHQSSETVGYLAIEQFTGKQEFTDGFHDNSQTPDKDETYERKMEVDIKTGVDSTWHTINFDQTYDTPMFMAHLQTRNGADPAWVQYRNLGSTSVEVKVDEGTTSDTETDHIDEAVGYWVMEGSQYFTAPNKRTLPLTDGPKDRGCGGWGEGSGCGAGSIG